MGAAWEWHAVCESALRTKSIAEFSVKLVGAMSPKCPLRSEKF